MNLPEEYKEPLNVLFQKFRNENNGRELLRKDPTPEWFSLLLSDALLLVAEASVLAAEIHASDDLESGRIEILTPDYVVIGNGANESSSIAHTAAMLPLRLSSKISVSASTGATNEFWPRPWPGLSTLQISFDDIGTKTSFTFAGQNPEQIRNVLSAIQKHF